MQTSVDGIDPRLADLLALEVADIVATANEQGFSTKEILAGLAQAVANSQQALEEDPDPSEDDLLPAGACSTHDLTDRAKDCRRQPLG